MKTTTKAYLYWTEKGRCLEELVNSKEILFSEMRSILSRDEKTICSLVHKINEYTQTIQELQSRYARDIGYTHGKIVREADTIVRTVTAKLEEILPSSMEIEKKINCIACQWSTALDTQEEDKLSRLASLIPYYQEVLLLETSLSPSTLGNPFYADFSSLLFIADADLAQKYLSEYAALGTVKQLQQFQQKFEREFLAKAEQERHTLRRQYHHPFFTKPEYALIEAKAITPFLQLYADLKLVLSMSEKYIAEKIKIDAEIKIIRKKIHQLRSKDSDEDLQLLTASISPQVFKYSDSLYLSHNKARYRQACSEYTQALSQKRKESADSIIRQLGEMPAEIEQYDGEAYALFLTSCQKKFNVLKERLGKLGIQESSLYEPVELLLANPPPGPIGSKAELWDFAYRYSILVQDESLAGICEQVSGFKKGKCITMKPLVQRLGKSASMCTTDITPDLLSAEEQHIYHRLHTAINKYTGKH